MDVATRCTRRTPSIVLLLAVMLAGLTGHVPSIGATTADRPPLIDINTASAGELAAGLPGIGAVKAQAIVAYRDGNGSFASVDALLAVKGIGPKTLERLRDLVTVGEELAAVARERERTAVRAVRRVIERSHQQALAASVGIDGR